MNCPECGKEMESGWLHADRFALWSPKAVKLTVLMGRRDVDLQQGGTNPEAHICRECQTVLVKYKKFD